MSVLKMLRELDRKFSWSFFGFLLAILLALFTLYDRFLAEKNPQIYLDVLTSASVLDIREDIPKLDISFDGIAIREQRLSLRILSIKVINDSSQDILKNHYDSDDPLGLKLTSGKIIRAEVTDTSNEYLKRNLSLSTPSNNALNFKSVIFEAHQYVVVKLLVLHPVEQIPSVVPVGHIAGMKQILVREPYKERTRMSFWSQTFAGTWDVQGVRLVSYLILSILCFLLVVFPVNFIETQIGKAKRKTHVRNFKAVTKRNLNENDEFIFAGYIEKGDEDLSRMQELIKNDKFLHELHARHLKAKEGTEPYPDIEREPQVIWIPAYSPLTIFGELIDSGFIKADGESLSVDPHMKETLDHFIRYLKNTGVISPEEKFRRKKKSVKVIEPPIVRLESTDAEQTNSADKQ